MFNTIATSIFIEKLSAAGALKAFMNRSATALTKAAPQEAATATKAVTGIVKSTRKAGESVTKSESVGGIIRSTSKGVKKPIKVTGTAPVATADEIAKVAPVAASAKKSTNLAGVRKSTTPAGSIGPQVGKKTSGQAVGGVTKSTSVGAGKPAAAPAAPAVPAASNTELPVEKALREKVQTATSSIKEVASDVSGKAQEATKGLWANHKKSIVGFGAGTAVGAGGYSIANSNRRNG